MTSVLVLTYRFPSHDHTADRRTVLRLGDYLRRQGMRVHLLALAATAEELAAGPLNPEAFDSWDAVVKPRYRSAIDALTGLVRGGPLQQRFFESAAFRRRIDEAIAAQRIDYVFAYHIRTAQYLPGLPVPAGAAFQPAQILHFGRRAEVIRDPITRLVYWVERSRLEGYERELASRIEHAFLISETDWDAIDPGRALKNVVYAPHGVDTDFFHPEPAVAREPGRLVITGMMGMDTNADAAVVMARDVLPIVRRDVPEATLWIVGSKPLPAVRRLHDPANGITVTGFVDDIRPYLWKAAVAVNPIRIAAGLQNKVLEALATGVPMVASRRANEGLGIPDDAIALVDGGAEEFAASVVRLLRDDAARAELGRRGREYVASNWSWDAKFEIVKDAILGAVESRRPDRAINT